MKIAPVILGAVLLGLSLPAEAKLEVTTEPAIKDGQEFIGVSNWCKDFPTDAFIAHAADGAKELTSIQYCAAYGLGSAEGFTDKTGRYYVLIRRDTVHASSYVLYDLDIYRIVPGHYFKLLSMPVEESRGTCHREKYAYSIVDSPTGGLELHLHRQIEKNSPDCDDQPPKGMPLWPDEERVIRIDAK